MTTELDALPESVRRIADRLDELSDAVTKSDWNAFSMRVPAEPERDADLVLAQAAFALKDLTVRVQELEREKIALIAERDHAGMLQRRAEAELAAIKKRIVDAQVEQVRDDESTGLMLVYGPHVLACFDKADVGKRVALLPLDDEAKS